MSIRSDFRATLAENAGTGAGNAVQWKGGKGLFMAEATFGGGNVKMQFQSPNGTWIDFPGTTLTANGGVVVDMPPGQVRYFSVTATAVFAYLVTV